MSSFIKTQGRHFFLVNTLTIYSTNAALSPGKFFSQNMVKRALKTSGSKVSVSTWVKLKIAPKLDPAVWNSFRYNTAPSKRSIFHNIKASFLTFGTGSSREAGKSSARQFATHREIKYQGSYGGNGGGYGGRGGSNGIWKYWNTLRKPVLFSVAVVGFNALALPFIFQLPGINTLRRRPDLLVYGLIALNGLVFLAWKAPQYYRLLNRYALLQKDSSFNMWSMIGSAFSHQEFWHLGINMFVLYQFGLPMARMLGSENFLEIYLDGAVLSSLGSIAFPLLLRQGISLPSLGASGAVFTMFGTFSYLIPHAKLALFFVPLPFGAWYVFLLAAGYNAVQIVLRKGTSDYAGHLAGCLVGAGWGYILNKRRDQNRRQRLQGSWGF